MAIEDRPGLRAGEEGRVQVVVGRHMLYRQAKQRRAIRSHQFHVPVVRKLKDMLCVPPRCRLVLSHCMQCEVSQVEGLAGVVLAWVDTTRDDSTEGCPVLQQGLASHR